MATQSCHFTWNVGSDHYDRVGGKNLLRHWLEVGLGHRAGAPHPQLPGRPPKLRLRLPHAHSGSGRKVRKKCQLNPSTELGQLFEGVSKERYSHWARFQGL